ncbi:hypothetical protein [Kineosporia babensis]|uniref:Uncharacterized protein n=1 Tax=Kineosporia babensis TaxID=499548 RepID=A0A9X1NCU4_9ACTN|nr:hypothetical protein [Kineosporia babensis]MCD5312857.1 hypothetical protein [Kineosporia babensis]
MITTAPDLRVLHAVRTLGYADIDRIAERAHLMPAEAQEYLLDAQAFGQVSWSEFGGDGGWSLTESGKAHGETLLAAELDAAGARELLEQVHQDFLPLNRIVAAACSGRQLTELGLGEQTLSSTLAQLAGPADALRHLEARLTTVLRRFCGYHARFAGALEQAAQSPEWITATDRDSCHRVWFELHEDLIATLGLTR